MILNRKFFSFSLLNSNLKKKLGIIVMSRCCTFSSWHSWSRSLKFVITLWQVCSVMASISAQILSFQSPRLLKYPHKKLALSPTQSLGRPKNDSKWLMAQSCWNQVFWSNPLNSWRSGVKKSRIVCTKCLEFTVIVLLQLS